MRLDIRVPLLCSVVVMTNTEMFTSIVNLEILPYTLKNTIDYLDNHISKQEQKLYILTRYADRYKIEHDKAMENIPNYLENPIKAFTLIKQLTSDLDSVKIIMGIKTDICARIWISFLKSAKEENKMAQYFIIKGNLEFPDKTENHEDIKYPELKDLLGAVSAIARLQKTYNLSVKDLSTGNLGGVAYRPPLTAGDCYEIGKVLLNEKLQTLQGLPWMVEALGKYDNEDNTFYSFTDINIIMNIDEGYHNLGDMKSALQWTKKLLNIVPKDVRARQKVTYYQERIAEEEAQKTMAKEAKDTDKTSLKIEDIEKETDTYEALCRGDIVVPIKISSRFYCSYLTENQAFLKIAPIKMEILYLNPAVILFYEVVSESEIEFIKQTTRSKLKTAQVHDPETGRPQSGEQRISKFTWILDKESRTISRISRRIMHMTNLNMRTAEPLQVVNYGIAGYFAPHCDFPPDIRYAKSGGDRIATVMFYLSDVAQGGATVFPELGLNVHPVKGAAIYWPNLNAAGEFEVATLHGGCPVLLGSKWETSLKEELTVTMA